MFASIRARVRRAEVVSTTITEILFLFVFALLAYTHYAEVNHQKETSVWQAENEDLKRALASVREELVAVRRKAQELQNLYDALQRKYDALLTSFTDQAGRTLRPEQVASELDRLRRENELLKSQL